MKPYIQTYIPLLFIFVANCQQSIAQAVGIEWSNALGGAGYDFSTDVIQTPDSGYLVVGNTSMASGDVTEFFGGAQDIWVIKLSQDGSLEWQKSYGGSGFDDARSVVGTSDNHFLIAGYTTSTDHDVSFNHGFYDVWVFKINIEGDLIWEKTYGGSSSERGYSICGTNDGNFVLAGTSTLPDGDVTETKGGLDFWVLKIDGDGALLWQNSYGSSLNDEAYTIDEAASGEIIVGGITASGDGDVFGFHGLADIYDGWVIALFPDGILKWSKAFGGTDHDLINSLYCASDSTIRCVGITSSNDGDIDDHIGTPADPHYQDCMYLILDVEGNLVFQKCYGGTAGEGGYKIIPDSEGGDIIGCRGTSNDVDVTYHHGDIYQGDYWIVSIDSIGNIVWERSLGGSAGESVFSIINTLDSGLVLSGYSQSYDGDVIDHYPTPASWDSWIVKLSPPCPGTQYFVDADADDFGNAGISILSCTIPVGFVSDSTDCNDTNPFIHPDATEICNAIDDNCNTDIDEGLTIYTLYADADNDTYGNSDFSIDTCVEIVSGFVSNSLDCNDSLALIYPGAVELCNYLDDDCDGLTDENLIYILSYQDNDDDIFGNPLIDSLSCELPEGYVADNTDCDDTNADIYPGAEEVLNGVDDDCDQIADEGLSIVFIDSILFSVYPNPTKNFLELSCSTTIHAFNCVTIFNLKGEPVASYYDISFPINLDVNKYPSGLYFIKLTNNGNVIYLSKFIKTD